MRVLLRAPLLSLSGYGVHARQIFEWLESYPNIELTTEVVQWGMTTWLVDSTTPIVQRIMNKSVQKEGVYDLSVQVQLPDEWDPNIAKRNIGISAFVETDRCSRQWIEKCNEMDLIVVPSTFTKNVAIRSGNLTTPIVVVPEWYSPEIEKVKKKNPFPMKLKTKFNFLLVGTTTGRNAQEDRKNIFNTIKWFCETFKGNKDVGLIVKTSQGRGTKIDKQITLDLMRRTVSDIRKDQFPKVHVLHGNLTEKEIAELYYNRHVKCLVSATRGEGYGLPLVEAGAAGLPIIVTGWSGHMDFLDQEMTKVVDYKLIKIPKEKIDNRVFIEGTRWADPIEADFKKSLLEVYNKHNTYLNLAKKQKKSIRNNFSKRKVLAKYDELFKKYL